MVLSICLISTVQLKSPIQPLVKLLRLMKLQLKLQKTGKVTAVVAVMWFFRKKRCKLRSAYLRNEKSSRQKAERADFPEENTHWLRSLSQKLREGRIPKKLAPKLKKLELNRTNLVLNSKKTRSDCTKMPDPGVSSGLKVKNKTIRVLLDSGSSGDILFMKKGSSKCISVVWSRLSLSRGALPMAPSSQTRWQHWNLFCGVLGQQESLPSAGHCRV